MAAGALEWTDEWDEYIEWYMGRAGAAAEGDCGGWRLSELRFA